MGRHILPPTDLHLGGLVWYPACAALAHGTLVLLTATVFTRAPIVQIQTPSYAWITGALKANGTNALTAKTHWKTYDDIKDDSDWQDNCHCVEEGAVDDAVCDVRYCQLARVNSLSRSPKIDLQNVFILYFLCSFAQHTIVV